MNVINLIDGTSVIFSKNNGAVHLRKDHISQKTWKNKKQKDDFRKELDAYQAQGIPLWADGRAGSPKEIWKAHKIAEDISYMRDYVRILTDVCSERSSMRWRKKMVIHRNYKWKQKM